MSEEKSADQLTTERKESQKARQRLRRQNQSEEKRNAERARHLHENMSAEQIGQHRNRNIHENMNVEQINEHRNRNIHENMNVEQITRHRARSSTVFFKIYDQEWDYENRCQTCNCLYLKSETNRKVCCNEGEWVSENSYFPQLNPLPQAIRHFALNRINHFGTKCGFYNNLFSMAITGVDNGRKGVGYETMNMTACVKLNG